MLAYRDQLEIKKHQYTEIETNHQKDRRKTGSPHQQKLNSRLEVKYAKHKARKRIRRRWF